MAIKPIQFPGAIDDNDSLFVATNNTSSVLVGDITPTSTSIELMDATTFPASGFVSIDLEIIHYTSKTGNILDNCTRAADDTIAVDHYDGAIVQLNVIAIHHNRLKDVLVTIENMLGINGVNVNNPAGTMMPFAGNSAPTGYLMCNGSAVSRITYASLFAVIGTTYGNGDGLNTFNIPDARGRTLVGQNATDSEFNTLGQTGGEKSHILLTTEMPSHDHQAYASYDDGSGAGGAYWTIRPWKDSSLGVALNNPGYQTIAFSGGNLGHNNIQPYLTTNYIIKF